MATILGRGTILFVDSNNSRATALKEVASEIGYNCTIENAARSALRRVKARSVNVIVASSELTDLHMDVFLESLSRANVNSSVVIYGKNINAAQAITWMRAGVVDILLDPDNTNCLTRALQNAFSRSSTKRSSLALSAKREPTKQNKHEGMLYRSRAMSALMEKANRVAPISVTVLLTGESGSGKDVLSRESHFMSRRTGAYVALNCAAIPETLLESELFGHERGAFTGASSLREGKFEAANHGTLLLDEIGDMPLSLQAKLLRVLEDGQITRLGSNTPVSVDVRLIAATNQNLLKMVAEGSFRQDLFYRLKVVELDIPPLRSRKSDIPLLAMSLLRQSAEKFGLSMPDVSSELIQRLKTFNWPGNVRQLKNLMESLLVTTQGTITVEDLPDEFERVKPDTCSTLELCLPMTLADIEDEVINKTLSLTGGNRTKTASLLGIGRRTLQRRLESSED